MKRWIACVAFLTVLFIVVASSGRTPTVRILVPPLADSAGTVTDGAVGTDQMDDTNVLDILAPGFRIFSDSLVLNAAWIGYHTYYEDSNSGDNVDTNFVACPIVGDSTDTAIFLSPYHSWLGIAFDVHATVGQVANRTEMHHWICQIDSGSGFWIRASLFADNYQTQGDWWVAFRFGTPP